jgi:hypothetical protein
MRVPLAVALAAAMIAVSGCGNGDDESAADTTPTTTTAKPPAASTLPTGPQTQQQTAPARTTPYSTAPQAPGEGDGNGGATAPAPGNGGTPAP